MASTRINKVDRLIQKELGDIFQRKSRDTFHGALLTVTQVRVTADLSEAKVYVSIYPTDKRKEIIAGIELNNKSLKHELAQRIKLQLRKIPELKFFSDDSLDYVEKIDNLLKQ